MQSQLTQLEGKAWWTQLQYDRAIEAGCQFCIQRPATTDGRNKLRQLDAHAVAYATARPCTVSASHTTNAMHNKALEGSQQFGCKLPCIMRKPSSAKLPARKAVSRHLNNEHVSSTLGSSCRVPASRGNDWSPVHSRPGTRGPAISHQQTAKLHPERQSTTTPVAGLQSPAGKPPQHRDKQQQLLTATADVHRSAPLAVTALAITKSSAGAPGSCSTQAVVALPSTPSSQMSAGSSTHPSTQTSAASIQPASTQTSTASLTLSATVSSASNRAIQGRAELDQVAKVEHKAVHGVRQRSLMPQQRVKVVSALHPGPRQHKMKVLEVTLRPHAPWSDSPRVPVSCIIKTAISDCAAEQCPAFANQAWHGCTWSAAWSIFNKPGSAVQHMLYSKCWAANAVQQSSRAC